MNNNEITVQLTAVLTDAGLIMLGVKDREISIDYNEKSNSAINVYQNGERIGGILSDAGFNLDFLDG